MAANQSPFQASIRSLPPGKLQDLCHKFDNPPANAAEGLTGTKCASTNTNEHRNIANEKTPVDQDKRGMLPIGSKLVLSSTCQESPSNCSTSIHHETDHASEHHTEKGHSSVPADIRGIRFSDTQREHTVLKIKDKYESNSCGINAEITAKIPSRYRYSTPDIGKKSPVLLQRKKEPLKYYEEVDNNGDKSCLDVKVLPPHPVLRLKSLSEKHDENDTSYDHGDFVEEDHTEKSTDKKLFLPLTKPQRTWVHDDCYIMAKKPNVNVIIQKYEYIGKINKTTGDKGDLKTHIRKPSITTTIPPRPTPFMKNFRSSSGASEDHVLDYKSTDVSNSGEEIKDNNLFYEASPACSVKQVNSPIHHKDLLCISYPEPNQRSLSAECIQKIVDEEDTVVYLDPNDSSGSCDVCLDSERIDWTNGSDFVDSAVPSKHIPHKVKSKIKRFRNFFTDSSDVNKLTQSNPKARLSAHELLGNLWSFFSEVQVQLMKENSLWRNQIRQKVNEAFEILQNSKSDCNDDSAEKQSNGSDSSVEHVKIQKCIDYCRSVRIKTSQSKKQYQEKSYPQLFELAMIVGLELNSNTGVYKPYIIYKFPEIDVSSKDSSSRLSSLRGLFINIVLDTAANAFFFDFKKRSDELQKEEMVKTFLDLSREDYLHFLTQVSVNIKLPSQSYNFVLTQFDGQRLYGYCRRLMPPKSPNKTPEVICIISPVDAFMMYNTLLKEIEKKRLISMNAAQELISAAFGRPLPQPGEAEIIRALNEHGDEETISLNRETDSRWESVSCECLLTSLGSETLLKVFSSMLLERSILFCAKQLSTLSSTIHAIVSLLYPLAWQHTFIPVLPSEMIEVICSPTPYIIGITASLIHKALTLPLDEHVLVVDIDKRSLLKSQGDEKTLLPHKIEKALKRSLNMCKIDADAKCYPDMMISEAFLRFFVEVIGHYGQHIIAQDDKHKIFQKREFLNETRSKTLKQLLEWLVETQMFEMFIIKQMEKSWGNTLEYFERRVREHNFTAQHAQRESGHNETTAT